MNAHLLLAALLLAGCGPGHAEKSDTVVSKSDELSRRRDAALQDFPLPGGLLYEAPKDCDYTLWAGEAAAGGAKTDLTVVEYAPGEVHRRPRASGECYPDDSHSKTSNDQISGYMAGAFARADLGALQRLAAYGEAHAWVMGEPASAVGEVVLKEPLIGLLGRMVYRLSSGQDDRLYRHLAPLYLPVTDDYAQHVQVLQILYQGSVDASLRAAKLDSSKNPSLVDIDDQMLKRLREAHDQHPENYFFAAALAVYNGAYDGALDLLLAAAPEVPSYVRGERPDIFERAHWLLAASVVLAHYPAGLGQ